MSSAYKDIMTFFGEDAGDENARRSFFKQFADFVTDWKKSRDKNIELEETRRRNEASMKRKAGLTSPTGQTESGGSVPPSPGATGDMDTLLAKLRAAKPEARDQRERRRRARLKDKHAIRVASGRAMPEMSDLVNDSKAENVLLSPVKSNTGSSSTGTEERGILSPGSLAINDEEDLGMQAEKLLEGLGGDDEDGKIPIPRESIRMSRRRKEGASDERTQRRRRGQLAMSASEASLENHVRHSMASQASTEDGNGELAREKNTSILEESESEVGDDEEGDETPRPAKLKNIDDGAVIVTPPSPRDKAKVEEAS